MALPFEPPIEPMLSAPAAAIPEGNYEDSCTACLRACDTAIALEGTAESHITNLMVICKMSQDVATGIVEDFDTHRRAHPEAPGALVLRLCTSCAQAAGLRIVPGLVAGGALPRLRGW